MDKQGKKTKETADEGILGKMSKGKVIGIAVFVLLILFNVFWSLMSGKITEEIQAVKAEISQVGARVAEAEKETLDVEAVKADVEIIRKATGDFDKKLDAVVKAEEARLEILAKNLEAQKAYVETLKSLLGEVGK
jgi:YbbR domain-containing protein